MDVAGVFDAIVVGAGPAGSTAARFMAAAGLRVLVLEKGGWPRAKVCGGGVTGRAAAALGLRLDPAVERRIARLAVSCRGRTLFHLDYGRPLIFMVMRSRLDALLMEAAERAGARFLPRSRVVSLAPGRRAVVVGTADGRRYAGRYLVGADGVHSAVAKLAGLATGKPLSLALEWEVIPAGGLTRWSDVLALDSGVVPSGYGWIFPKAHHLSVGVGGAAQGMAALRAAAERMLRAYGVRGAVAERRGYWLSAGWPPVEVQRGRVLLIGDAAGLVDPFLGEGIYYAAWSGRLAAEAVAEALRSGGEPAYGERVTADMLPELRRAHRLMRWFYRWHRPLPHRRPRPLAGSRLPPARRGGRPHSVQGSAECRARRCPGSSPRPFSARPRGSSLTLQAAALYNSHAGI